jgi:hypothetical protein
MNIPKVVEHLCDNILQYREDLNLSTEIRCFNGNWVFHRYHYACEKCVYDGEAKYEGELLSVFDLSINYCPYCGTLLNNELSTSKIHIDRFIKNKEHHCTILDEYNRMYPHVGCSFDTDAVWKVIKDSDFWCLSRHSIATERMVLAEEADEGELVYWHGTSVNYCPFCGDNLQD